MTSMRVDLEVFLNRENSILQQFSRTLFDRRFMNRKLINVVLRKQNFKFIQIKEKFL